MKNKIYLYTVLSLTASLLFISSCNLNRYPSNAFSPDDAVETVEHAKYWEAGYMAGLRTVQKGGFENLQDVQADQLNATVSFGTNMSDPYAWEPFKADNSDLASVYQGYYSRIKNINFSLPRMENIPTTNDSETAALHHAMGVGYLLRGYYYFNLAIRFGALYNATTAGKDLSVPLILEYEPHEMPSRNTNSEVYAQVLKDIESAKEHLKGYPGAMMSSSITIDAAKALEARVRFYMSDWQGSFEVAKDIITSGKYSLCEADEQSLRNMWHNSLSSEEIFQMTIERPEELPNTSNYYAATTAYDGTLGLGNTPDYLPTQWMIDLYEDNDLRKWIYFESQNGIYHNRVYPVVVVSKFKGDRYHSIQEGAKYAVWGNYLPNGLTSPKVFRLAEQYLIVAEAAYNLGKEKEALSYLNSLRRSRGLKALNTSGIRLFREIQDERTRELAYEGFRLWDLRRWNMPMERHDPQALSDGTTPFLYQGAGLTLSIPSGADKFVWGIPSNDIKTNKNIADQQNPGWGL